MNWSPIQLGARRRVDPGKMALDRYRRDANFLRALQNPVPATRTILLVLGGVFVVGLLLASQISGFAEVEDSILPSVVFGAKINSEVAAGAWWRLITNTMIHGGWLHLALNGYGLYLLGTITERLLGTKRFIVIYGIAGIVGSLASYWFNDAPSVGASGAIYGVFGAVIVFGFKFKSDLPERVGKALSTGLLPWLALSLAFGLLPMVDNAAHFGGLIAGSVLAAGMSSPLEGVESARWKKIVLGLVCIALAVAGLVALGLSAEFTAHCMTSETTWNECKSLVSTPD